MINFLAGALAGAAAVEMFARLPFIESVRRIARSGRTTAWVISSSKISDHWKEKVLLAYSGQMARQSCLLIIYLGVIAAVLFAISLAMDFALPHSQFGAFMLSLMGTIWISVVATVYALVRFRRGTA